MMTSLFTASICVISAGLATALAAERMPAPSPRRLAIYYGIPSLVNGAGGDTARAVGIFSDYDILVFGDGLEFDDVVPSRKPAGAGPLEHQRTKEIIARLAGLPRRTEVFGYVDLGRSQQLTLDEIRERIQRWKSMGASGIFFDEAGADFGVDRPRQNAAVDAAHAAGLPVVLNAFNPDDVFRTGGDRVRPRIGAGDAYLLESFAVRNGTVEDPRVWRERVHKAFTGSAATGVALWATTTTQGQYEAALMDHAWHAARQAGVEAFGWGEPLFGSADSRLPFRPRPR
jgi:hypothetical protein